MTLPLFIILAIAQFGGTYRSPVYPQGISCDPQTGILYNLEASGNPNTPLRTSSGCAVNVETGIISCSISPSNLNAAIQ